MRITDVLDPLSISVNLDMTTKDQVLNHMIDLLDNSGVIEDISATRSVIFEREAIMSTGVGNGFACPHAKSEAIQETAAALATMRSPIEFAALDSQPVNIVFMLVGRPNSVSAHLRLLSRVSRLMNVAEVRSRLLSSTTPEEARSILDQEEQNRLD